MYILSVCGGGVHGEGDVCMVKGVCGGGVHGEGDVCM